MILDAIHPSVIFHDNKYWMAYTPYPDWDVSKENPSILTSDNGKDWTAPCNNPIVPAPNDGGHNCDPFLFFDKDKFKCVFCHYFVDKEGTENTIIKTIESPDGKDWGNVQNILEATGVYISPCVVDGELWYIKVGAHKKGEKVTPYGLFTLTREVDFFIPNYHIWHFEIRKFDTYRMLISAYPVNSDPIHCKLFIAESDNAKGWEVNIDPIFKSYKATCTEDRIWYSFLDDKNRWCIDDAYLG